MSTHSTIYNIRHHNVTIEGLTVDILWRLWDV